MNRATSNRIKKLQRKKSFDAEQFYSDYGVETASSGHKHARVGWVQVECPFCAGNPGYHLGFALKVSIFNCWRCGRHSIKQVIQEILGLDSKKAEKIRVEYSTRDWSEKEIKEAERRAKEVSLPQGSGPLKTRHISYLRTRGYPEWVEETYDLRGMGLGGEYSLRLMIPIHFQGQLVSFTSRDITNLTQDKYKSCPDKDEVISHKEILYGFDLVPGNSVVVVEGPSDVWRIGPGAVATFGVEYKSAQVDLLVKSFDRAVVLFDSDRAGKRAGRSLAAELSFRGVDCIWLPCPAEDPGKMTECQTKKIRELGGLL